MRYLGYLLEADLSGAAHLARSLAMAKGRAPAVEAVAKVMGEAYALQYVQTVVAPAVLYALELSPAANAGGRSRGAAALSKVHTILLAEAVRLRALDEQDPERLAWLHERELPLSARARSRCRFLKK